MSRRYASRMALASAAALGISATATITISPTSHDFGQAARRGLVETDFTITVSPVTPGATVRLSITGPDAADFAVSGATNIFPNNPTDCQVGSQRSVCQKGVEFRPQATSVFGPKVATLMLTDGTGTRVTAPLKGEVVAALCRHVVVPCNYSHHYSGVFGWTSTLNGPASQYKEDVHVDVLMGAAACNGFATQSDQGRHLTGPITGPGLIGVEFDRDDTYITYYKITVACPSPDWPATVDAVATPSRPAELGHNEYSSDQQPLGMTIQQVNASPPTLKKSINYPSPDTDAANGVTGVVTVSWNLCPNSQYIIPQRLPGSLRQGRCP